jgi:hypothetical protein
MQRNQELSAVNAVEYEADPDTRFEDLVDNLDCKGFFELQSEGMYEIREGLSKCEPYEIPDIKEINAMDIINLFEEGKRDNVQQLEPLYSWIVDVMQRGSDLFSEICPDDKDYSDIFAALIISAINAMRDTGFDLEAYLQGLQKYGETEDGVTFALCYYADKKDVEAFIWVCKATDYSHILSELVTPLLPKFDVCDQQRIQEYLYRVCEEDVEQVPGQY